LSEHFCAPTSTVLSGHAAASDSCSPSLPSNQVEIAGILPDGAADPIVTLSDGSTAPLAAQGNVYLQQFNRSSPLPRSIEWGSGANRQSHSANLPPDAATLTCITPNDLPGLIASGKLPPPPPGHPLANPGPITRVSNGG
jgi:hypothetical protein